MAPIQGAAAEVGGVTLGDLLAAAAAELAAVRASRRRAIVRRMQRTRSRQRARDLLDLGWREPDAGWPDAQGDTPTLPVIGYRDLGGES